MLIALSASSAKEEEKLDRVEFMGSAVSTSS